jgi:hypothetical protein
MDCKHDYKNAYTQVLYEDNKIIEIVEFCPNCKQIIRHDIISKDEKSNTYDKECEH